MKRSCITTRIRSGMAVTAEGTKADDMADIVDRDLTRDNLWTLALQLDIQSEMLFRARPRPLSAALRRGPREACTLVGISRRNSRTTFPSPRLATALVISGMPRVEEAYFKRPQRTVISCVSCMEQHRVKRLDCSWREAREGRGRLTRDAD